MHQAYAAWKYLEDHNTRDSLKRIDTKHLAGLQPARLRSVLYNDYIKSGYWREREETGASWRTSLPNKLARFVDLTPPAPQAAKWLQQHARAAAPKIRPNIWNLQLRLTFNALGTDKRRSQAKMEVAERPRPGVESPYPCYLCGRGDRRTASNIYLVVTALQLPPPTI